MAQPGYMVGAKSREEVEAMCRTAGMQDGMFCFRDRPGEADSFALCIVYRGKPTHHLLKMGPPITINGMNFGDFRDIPSLVQFLGTPKAHPKWPVPFGKPLGETKRARRRSSKGSMKVPPKWLHPKMNKAEANAVLTRAGLVDGKFFVRPYDDSKKAYVITVCFRGKPTQHLAKKTHEGVFNINNKPAGDMSTIRKLIKHLEHKWPYWPVPLTDVVPAPGAAAAGEKDEKDDAPPARPTAAKPSAAGRVPASAPAPSAAGADDWLFGEMTKEESEAKIQVGTDGSFCVRPRGSGHKDHYVLTVVYRGNPTHHLMQKRADGVFCVNKKAYGSNKTVQALVHTLMKPSVPNWPVPLTYPAAGGMAHRGAASAPAPTPTPVAAEPAPQALAPSAAPAAQAPAPSAAPAATTPAPSAAPAATDPVRAPPPAPAAVGPSSYPWLYGAVTRDDSELLLKTYGQDEGDFLVRVKDSSQDKYHLALTFKGKPTHHLVEKTDGNFVVNKTSFGAAPSLGALIDILRGTVAGWPLPLKGGVIAPNHHPGADWKAVGPLPGTDAFRRAEDERFLRFEAEHEFHQVQQNAERKAGWIRRAQEAAALAWQRSRVSHAKVETAKRKLATVTPIEVNEDVPSYLYDELHKYESVSLMSALGNGTFLVRRKKGHEKVFFLDLKYDGEVTTHLIELVDVEEEVEVTVPGQAKPAKPAEPAEPALSLDDAQAQGMTEEMFAQVDTDKSGYISQAELTDFMESHGLTTSPAGSRDESSPQLLQTSAADALMSGMEFGALGRPDTIYKLAELFVLADQSSASSGPATEGAAPVALPDGLVGKLEIEHRLDRNMLTRVLIEAGSAEKLVAQHGRAAGGAEGAGSIEAAVDTLLRHAVSRATAEGGIDLETFIEIFLHGKTQVRAVSPERHSSQSRMLSPKKQGGSRPSSMHTTESDQLKETITLGQVEAAQALLTVVLAKARPDINVSTLFAELAREQGPDISLEAFLVAVMPGANIQGGGDMSPRDQILKSKLTEWFFRAWATPANDVGRSPTPDGKGIRDQSALHNALEALRSNIAKQIETGEVDASLAGSPANAGPEAPPKPTTEIRIRKVYFLNGQDFGGFGTLDDLLFRLKSPIDGWPIVLTRSVLNPLRNQRRVPLRRHESGEPAPDAPSYVWANITLDDAEKKVIGPDGTFLLRRKIYGIAGEYTLSVKFQGHTTHHAVVRGVDGDYTVNQQRIGAHDTLDGLIEELGKKQPGSVWPVVLSNPIRPPGSNAPAPPMGGVLDIAKQAATALKIANDELLQNETVLRAADARAEAAVVLDSEHQYDEGDSRDLLRDLDCDVAKGKIQACEKTIAKNRMTLTELQSRHAAGLPLPGLFVETDPNRPSYAWGLLTKSEVEEKMFRLPEGSFLLRRRALGPETDYNLCIVFGGRPTHHAVEMGPGGLYLVNGQPVGGDAAKTVDSLIKVLFAGAKGWPVRLTAAVIDPAKRPRPRPIVLEETMNMIKEAELELEAAKRELWVAERRSAKSVQETAHYLSTGLVNPAQVVRGNIAHLLAKLLVEITSDYRAVTGSRAPELPAEQTDVLLSSIAAKLNEQPSAQRSRLVRRKSAKAVEAPNYTAVVKLQAKIGHATVARELLESIDAASKAETATAELQLDNENLSETLAAMAKVASSAESGYAQQKLDYTDLQKRLRQGREQDQRSSGAIPPAEFQRLSQLLRICDAKLEKFAAEYERSQATLAILRAIQEKPHQRQFYLRMVEHLNSVMLQARKLHLARQAPDWTREGKVEGIYCAFGFVPVPQYGEDAGAALLFSPGVLADENAVIEAIEATAALLTFRFQDQVQRLQYVEVERFARWFAAPIIEMLFTEPGTSNRMTLKLTKAGEKSFGIRLQSDEESGQSAHRISRITPGGPGAKGGCNLEDIVLSINGMQTSSMAHDKILETMKSNQEVTLRIGRGRHVVPPRTSSEVPAFVVRAVDQFNPTTESMEEYDNEPAAALFNGALGGGLLGGLLIPASDGVMVEPWKFVHEAGLRFESAEGELLYYSADQTDTDSFGYRYQLPDCFDVYSSRQEELQALGWTNPYFLAHVEEDDEGIGTVGAKSAPAPAATTVSLLKQKTLEAQQLEQRVLDLESKLRQLAQLQGGSSA